MNALPPPRPPTIDPVDIERMQRVDALVEEALTWAPDERAHHLAMRTEGDRALLQEVQALLAACAAAADRFETPAIDQVPTIWMDAVLAKEATPEDESLPLGHRVGPYRIEAQVGAGGMGVVYRATRADGQFARTVALKVVKRGMDTDEVLRRFQFERHVLARLEHPHIARLYGGGVTDDGRPWLAMEYVEGTPVTDYAAAHDLEGAARLALLRTVCEAVAYAHQRLVVHRDLKPSNILVREDQQGRPHVVLLDFGIARLLDASPIPELGGVTLLHTARGAQRLTPNYAAPEQVQGHPPTTATDVYALGVLGYELLAGVHPYTFAVRTFAEIERVVCGTVPPRPSTVAAASQAPFLRGDLDAILLKALKKEPERRYVAAADFGDDLDRLIAGQPVSARDDSARYRTAKFIQRHRSAVGVGTLAVLALVMGLVLALWQASVAAAERDAKSLEAARAQATLAFAYGLLDEVSPGTAQGQPVEATDLFMRGVREASLVEEPRLHASLLGAVGQLSYRLGNFAMAESLLTLVAAEQRALYDARPDEGIHTELAETLYMLGQVHLNSERYEEARMLFNESEGLSEAYLSDASGRLLLTRGEIAYSWYAEGDVGEALRRYESVLEAWPERQFEAERGQVLSSYGEVLDYAGRDVEAEDALRAALVVLTRTLGTRHPAVADTQRRLGGLLVRRGDYGEGIALLEAALASTRVVLGQHVDVAQSEYYIGWAMATAGDTTRALRYLHQSAASYEEAAGVRIERGYPYALAGKLYVQQARATEAEGVLKAAIEIYEATEADPYFVARPHLWMAQALVLQERYEEAAPLARRALAYFATDPDQAAKRAEAEATLAAIQRNSPRQRAP
ncbi:MAG: serine/threonine-protein kinase [Bacteroidota bacterium]